MTYRTILNQRQGEEDGGSVVGIGKTKVVKVLQAGRQLLELDNSRAALAGVVHESILHS